ncbi:MAG: hypothetical protein ABI456_20960 [Ktedonobacteraceae bacterium]|nr:hypothetical protein [Chloroflexota bacterium]
MSAFHHDSSYDSLPPQDPEERGYPWLFLYIKRPGVLRLLVSLILILVGYVFYQWYSRYGSDPAPDSAIGFFYAFAGMLCALLAGIMYTRKRRSRKRVVGQLHGALSWHVCFAIMAVAFLFMHSFGNFNPRSGTYALYSMIALAVSGFIGRALDRIMPRLIAAEVDKALTAQGDDRMENISQKLQSIVVYNTEKLSGFTTSTSSAPARAGAPPALPANGLPFTPNPQTLHTPWDLAYISLEQTPQELSRGEPRYRFVPDRKSALNAPGALMPGAQEQMTALQEVQKALTREQFYRYIIRYWRVFHIALVLVTLGLTIWHLVYAAQLLIPVYFH